MLDPFLIDSNQVEYHTLPVLLTPPFQTRREDHQEDNHDGQQDEGAGHEGDLL